MYPEQKLKLSDSTSRAKLEKVTNPSYGLKVHNNAQN